jgi:hypothetical protein
MQVDPARNRIEGCPEGRRHTCPTRSCPVHPLRIDFVSTSFYLRAFAILTVRSVWTRPSFIVIEAVGLCLAVQPQLFKTRRFWLSIALRSLIEGEPTLVLNRCASCVRCCPVTI